MQAVHTWFKNNKPFKDKAVFKMERKIPLRRVVAKLKTDEIHRAVSTAHPDIEKGDKKYPGYFQKAVTKHISEMTKVETDEMGRIRDEWQNKGPPLDVQLKWVHFLRYRSFLKTCSALRAARKHSRKAIVDAHQLLYKEMYVSCITYSFYPDPDDGVYGIVWYGSLFLGPI